MFTDPDMTTIITALRVAAAVYDVDAKNARIAFAALVQDARPCRIADQFDKQARDARNLADRIEA